MAHSKHDKDIETQAALQAHYIQWCANHHIPNPCGPNDGYKRIVAIYLKDVMLGTNFNDLDVVRANTVHGYGDAVNIVLVSVGARQDVYFTT